MQKKLLFVGAMCAGLAAAALAVAPQAAISAALPFVPLVMALAIAAIVGSYLLPRLRPWQIAIWVVMVAVGALMVICGASWVDVGSAFVVANAPGGLEMKQIEDLIDNATKKVKETTDRMQQALDQAINDSKTVGTLQKKTADEAKAASEASAKTQGELKALRDELMARVLEVEQKAVKRPGGPGGEIKSMGQIAAESPEYKAAREAYAKSPTHGRMDPVEIGSFHKAPLMSSTVQTTGNISLVPSERVDFITPTQRQLVVRNLIPVMATESNMIEFWRENVFTNSAAPQGAGASPTNDSEFQPKAESGLTFTFVQVGMTTIAHWIPVSRQIFQDAKMLASYIEQRLRYGVLLEEEDEVLNSTGTNGELNGLINQATAYNRRATADSRLDTLLKAFLQVTLSDYAADGVVMSNVDWTEILLLKDTTGRYLFGDPASQQTPRIWGRPVVPTNTPTVGKFLTGAFQLSCALWDREQATVRIADQHSDFFVRNALCMLAEERVALAVYRPTGLIQGDFGAAAGQPG